jgi:ribosomal protein L37AE/L43A
MEPTTTHVTCPDCERGTIRRHDRCDECGLSWDDLEAAAELLESRQPPT